jgi:hypothetical protein
MATLVGLLRQRMAAAVITAFQQREVETVNRWKLSGRD